MSDKPETYDDDEVEANVEETFPASEPVPTTGGITGPDDKPPE